MTDADDDVFAISPSGERLPCRLETDLPDEPGWRRVVDLPLVILVGLTGAGKSTAVEAMRRIGLPYVFLPNRRLLADRFIIASMQAEEGRSGGKVGRIERLTYTRRYRDRHPGGIAHLLCQLCFRHTGPPVSVIFDGLRGEDEVRFAVHHLPHASFLVLDLPDDIRVKRLVQRADPFDQLRPGGRDAVEASGDSWLMDVAALAAPEAAGFLTPGQRDGLLAMVRDGTVTKEELRAKVRIVIEERRNYDPAAALGLLMDAARERTIVVDTSVRSPEEVVQAVIAYLSHTTRSF